MTMLNAPFQVLLLDLVLLVVIVWASYATVENVRLRKKVRILRRVVRPAPEEKFE
jgi:hypothetical protein